MKDKIINIFNKTINTFNLIIISFILILILFFNRLNYSLRNDYKLSFILLGIIFLVLIILLTNKIKINNKIFYIVCVLLFIIETYFVYNYYFYTGWDAGYIYTFSSDLIHAEWIKDVSYFSIHPNNILIVYFYQLIIKLLHSINLHAYEYQALLIFNLLISSLTGILIYKALNIAFEKKNYAFTGFIIYHLIIGLSPHISIPYSDCFGLIFPALAFYIYVKYESNLKYLFIFSISLFALSIKPQSFIVFIAIIIVSIISFIKNNLKDNAFIILYIIIGILISLLGTKLCTDNVRNTTAKYENIINDSTDKLSIAHYFMMGLNDLNGIYDYNDELFSISYKTKEERIEANLQEAFKRLKEKNIFEHLAKKTLTNYNDGSFAWSKEGNFYKMVIEEKNDTISPFLRNVYYDTGLYYDYYLSFIQGVWLGLLILIFISSFQKASNIKTILNLVFLGSFLFLTLFEARSRYLFTNVPLFIILATYGIDFLFNKKKSINL